MLQGHSGTVPGFQGGVNDGKRDACGVPSENGAELPRSKAILQVSCDLLYAQMIKAGSAKLFDTDKFHFAAGDFFVSLDS